MRLAVITSYFPSSAQLWQGRTAFETLRILARTVDLKVFSPFSRYPPLLRPKNRPSGFDPDFRLRDADGNAEVDVQYIPFSALPVISRPFNALLAARAVLPHVRAWQPDLLLSYVIYPDAAAALRIAQQLRLPLVTVAIGSDLNRIPNALIRREVTRTLERATLTTTVSADLARTAIRLGAPAARTRAILNGCDLSVFHPGDRSAARATLGLTLPQTPPMELAPAHAGAAPAAPDGAPGPPTLRSRPVPESPERSRRNLATAAPFTAPPASPSYPAQGSRSAASSERDQAVTPEIILYVGRLDLRKGLLELVDAAADLHLRRPNLHVYLLGHGPDGPAVQERIAVRLAGDYIHLRPSVPMREVATWMAAADLVTLPSWNEGCPNVIVEALAAGRPVVATDTGGIPELVDPSAGRLVPVRDPAALAAALNHVLSQPWSAATLHQQHSRSWDDVARDLYTTLREALTPTHP